MLFCALGLYTVSFSFAGGTDADFVEAAARQLKVPVALLAQEDRIWPAVKFEREPKDRKELLSVLANKLKLETLNENCLGISATAWPSDFYFTQRRSRYLLQPAGRPTVAHDAVGTFSVSTGERPALLWTVLAPMTKPVKWHWFFEGAALRISADHVKESDYVKLIARALGASLRETATEYRLDFDAGVYRKRGIALLEKLANKKAEDVLYVEDFLYTAEVLRWFTDAQLSAAMTDATTDTYRPEVMPKPVAQAARARLRRFFPIADDGIVRHSSTGEVWDRLKQRGDFERMTVVFMTKGASACMIPPKQKGGAATVF